MCEQLQCIEVVSDKSSSEIQKKLCSIHQLTLDTAASVLRQIIDLFSEVKMAADSHCSANGSNYCIVD